MTEVIRLAARYFGLVFALGFVLGILRTLWLVPLLGERWAELLELPFMLLASYVSACYLIARHPAPLRSRDSLWVGLLALGFLLAVEFTLVLGLRGLTFVQYLQSRNGVSGTAYVVSLLIFALLPYLCHARAQGGRR